MNKQPITSKTLLVACSAFMLVTATGCSTTYIRQDGDPRIGGPGLRASVRSAAENSDSQAVANGVAQNATDFLVSKGIVVEASQPNVVVGLTTSRTLFDQSGNYYVFEGKVLASAHLPDKTRIVATKTFNARGERKLDIPAAETSLIERISPQINKWIEESITPLRFPIALSDVTIQRQSFLCTDDTRFISSFVSQVGALDGVIGCGIRKQDNAQRLYTFEISYKADSFPEGLVNAIILSCPNLGLEYR